MKDETTLEWRRQADRYRHFAECLNFPKQTDGSLDERDVLRLNNLDFSEQAAVEMYRYETYGEGKLVSAIFSERGMSNGYAVGKRLLDIQVAMWRKDIQEGWLTKHELFSDAALVAGVGREWLERVLEGVQMNAEGEARRRLLIERTSR